MNLYVVTILLLSRMTQAAPTSTLKPKPTTQPKYIHPPPDEVPIINFNNQGDNWWRSLAIALAELRGGVSIRNVVSIKIDDKKTTETFNPPLQKDSDFDTADSPSSMAGSRALSFNSPLGIRMPARRPMASPTALDRPRASYTPIPEPRTGDIGICSTLIKGPSPKFTGKIYKTGRSVVLHREIVPLDISCRSNVPVSGHDNGKCIVVGYPHGAWVRAKPEELRHHNPSNCYSIKNSPDKQCWDYINVPGYCVQPKR